MADELATRDDLAAILRNEAIPEIEDPEQVKLAIVDQILSAETAEAILDNTPTLALGESIGRKIRVHDVRILRSGIEGAGPAYVLARGIDLATGEVRVFNTGAYRAMAQLWALKKQGLLPMDIEVVAVGNAKPGQSPPIGIGALRPAKSR